MNICLLWWACNNSAVSEKLLKHFVAGIRGETEVLRLSRRSWLMSDTFHVAGRFPTASSQCFGMSTIFEGVAVRGNRIIDSPLRLQSITHFDKVPVVSALFSVRT